MQEVWETQVWSLGREGPLEEEMAAHSSILVWRIPMDRAAWWATVHGVAKSWTWLKWLSMQACTDKIKPSPPAQPPPSNSHPKIKLPSQGISVYSIIVLHSHVLVPFSRGKITGKFTLTVWYPLWNVLWDPLPQYACSDQDWLTTYKRLFNTLSRKMVLCRPWWSFLTLESAFV